MNVLYLSYDGMTDPLGQSQVLPYLEGLSRLGVHFTLISFEKPAAFAEEKDRIRARCDAAGIKWRPLTYHKQPPVLSTLWDIRQMMRLARQLHQQKAFDLLHCRSYPAAMAGQWMKKRFGVPFIFDMRGFWADERVEGGVWRLQNPLFGMIYRFFKQKEREFLQEAIHSISLTQQAKQVIHSWPGMDAGRINITVIPCCVDLELFNYNNITEAQKMALRQSLGINSNSFVLSYLGSVGTWYMLDEMLAFFKRLLNIRPDARFLFINKGEHERIHAAAAQAGIPEASLVVRAASRQEVPALLALSTFSLFFILPSFSKQASSPTKHGEIMGMGIPLVCNTGIGDVDKIVTESRSGILVPAMQPADFDEAISRMQDNFDKAAIRQQAFVYYSLEEGVRRYAEVYRRTPGAPTLTPSPA